MPSTTSRKPRGPGRQISLMLFLLVAFIVAASFFARDDSDAPGEEARSRGIDDVAVSARNVSFPKDDTARFDRGTRVVYVYLRVSDLPADADLEATVTRTGTSSLFSRLFGRDEIWVYGGGEEQLSASSDGASGIVKFAVRAGEDRELPAGDYAVSVKNASGPAREDRAVVREYFKIGNRRSLGQGSASSQKRSLLGDQQDQKADS